MASPGKITALVTDHRQGMSAAGRASVDGAALARTGALKVRELPDSVLREIGTFAGKILDQRTVDDALEGLKSSRPAVRNAAMDRLQDMIAQALLKRTAKFDEKVMELAVQHYGPEALILIPEFAWSYRRHLVITGKTGIGQAADFAAYIARTGNRRLQAKMANRLGQGFARRLYKVSDDTAFSAANHSFSYSTTAMRDAAIQSLADVFHAVPEDLFFDILFAKIPNLIPKGQEKAIRAEIAALLNTGKISDDLTATGAQKLFLFADRSGLQGMIGELLVLQKQIERAKVAAKEADGPVYLLLGTKLDSARTMVPGKLRKVLDQLDRTTDLLDTRKGAEAFEKSVKAIENHRKADEFTDGLIGTFAGDGSFRTKVWTESKVDKTGTAVGLKQFDRNREDILVMGRMTASQVVKIEGDKVTYLTLAEAAKASGATVDAAKKVLVFAEDPKLLDRIAALEAQLEKGHDISVINALAKLRAERKLQEFHSAKKELYVGAEQKSKLARSKLARQADAQRVEVKDFGHDFQTVVDATVLMLANLGFKR